MELTEQMVQQVIKAYAYGWSSENIIAASKGEINATKEELDLIQIQYEPEIIAQRNYQTEMGYGE